MKPGAMMQSSKSFGLTPCGSSRRSRLSILITVPCSTIITGLVIVAVGVKRDLEVNAIMGLEPAAACQDDPKCAARARCLPVKSTISCLGLVPENTPCQMQCVFDRSEL